MRDFRSNNNRSGGRRSFERPQMHSAVCSNCGKDCQVPFKPSTDKPIYCDNCFEKKSPRENSRPERRNFDRPRFDRPQFDRPQFDRPRNDNNEALNKKIDQMNANLEQIIKLLTPKTKATKTAKTSKSKEE